MPIIYNQFKGTKAIVQVIANTETFQLSSFNQTANDQNSRTTTDTVNTLAINKIIFTGATTILRGANVVFSSANNVAGEWTLDTWGMSLTTSPTANITITNSANTTTLVELRKGWSGNTAY